MEPRLVLVAPLDALVEPAFFTTSLDYLRGDLLEPVLCFADGQLPVDHPCLVLPQAAVHKSLCSEILRSEINISGPAPVP